MSKKIKRPWASAALVVVLAACAPAAQQENVAFVQPAAAEEPTLIVQNDYFGDMDIYAVTGSTRFRLGSVMTGRSARLQIPRALLGRPDILLQADPVGPDAAFTFPAITVHPGATVELMVAPSLQMSSYSVW